MKQNREPGMVAWSKVKVDIFHCCLWNLSTSLQIFTYILSWFLTFNIFFCFRKSRLFIQNLHIITGLPRVREMSVKKIICYRPGKSQGILKKCQGISAFCHFMSGNCQGILLWHFYRLKLPLYNTGSTIRLYAKNTHTTIDKARI